MIETGRLSYSNCKTPPRFHHDDLACDHGLKYDNQVASKLSVQQIRNLYPRLFGKCPKGCGFDGIAYVSTEHFVAGDW